MVMIYLKSPSTDGSGDTNMPDTYIAPGLLLQLQEANNLIDTYIILISRIKENIISVLPLLSTSGLESTLINMEVIIRFHEYIFQYLGRYLNEYAELLGDLIKRWKIYMNCEEPQVMGWWKFLDK